LFSISERILPVFSIASNTSSSIRNVSSIIPSTASLLNSKISSQIFFSKSCPYSTATFVKRIGLPSFFTFLIISITSSFLREGNASKPKIIPSDAAMISSRFLSQFSVSILAKIFISLALLFSRNSLALLIWFAELVQDTPNT
jgi:hypothetical protein